MFDPVEWMNQTGGTEEAAQEIAFYLKKAKDEPDEFNIFLNLAVNVDLEASYLGRVIAEEGFRRIYDRWTTGETPND